MLRLTMIVMLAACSGYADLGMNIDQIYERYGDTGFRRRRDKKISVTQHRNERLTVEVHYRKYRSHYEKLYIPTGEMPSEADIRTFLRFNHAEIMLDVWRRGEDAWKDYRRQVQAKYWLWNPDLGIAFYMDDHKVEVCTGYYMDELERNARAPVKAPPLWRNGHEFTNEIKEGQIGRARPYDRNYKSEKSERNEIKVLQIVKPGVAKVQLPIRHWKRFRQAGMITADYSTIYVDVYLRTDTSKLRPDDRIRVGLKTYYRVEGFHVVEREGETIRTPVLSEYTPSQ